MNPAPSGGSLALQRVKLGDALEIHNGIIFDFYSGLPHIHVYIFPILCWVHGWPGGAGQVALARWCWPGGAGQVVLARWCWPGGAGMCLFNYYLMPSAHFFNLEHIKRAWQFPWRSSNLISSHVSSHVLTHAHIPKYTHSLSLSPSLSYNFYM